MFSVEQLKVLAEQFEIQFAGAQWKVEVFDDPHEGPAIYFTADVVDSYNPPSDIELRILSYLSPNDRRSVESFKQFILWRLKRIAIHEVGEGLRFSGELVWNPHEALEPGGREEGAA
ncbi:MAG TPA: hypothetical protein VJ742_05580 [Nitrososphaera sp.]|nr:hypothetical protein [Nitrososphaera sp.]